MNFQMMRKINEEKRCWCYFRPVFRHDSSLDLQSKCGTFLRIDENLRQ